MKAMGNIDLLASDLGFTEGPVWMPDGNLAVVSITHGCVYRLDPAGTVLQRIEVGGGPNGLAVDAAGTLYVAQNGGIWGAPSTAEPGVLRVAGGAVSYLVRGLGAPNDLCFGPDGRLYVTDPQAQIDPNDPAESPPGRVFAVDAATGATELVLEGPIFVNGLAFDPAGRHLLVIETVSRRIGRYALGPGGALESDGVYCQLDEGVPDGMAFDGDGNLWVGASLGDNVQVFDPRGRLRDMLWLSPGACPTNVCFGGEDGSTLFIAASMAGQVLCYRAGAAGLPLYHGPTRS